MAEWILRYADSRGEMHQQVATAVSEQELRDRLSQQGYLVYSIRPKAGDNPASASPMTAIGMPRARPAAAAPRAL